MIKELCAFAPWDSYSARVHASWAAYGGSAQFWLQDDAAAAIAIVDGFAVLAVTERTDWEELTWFLQLQPWQRLQCEERAARRLPFPAAWTSCMLHFDTLKQPVELSLPCLQNPEPQLVYDLLTACGFPGMQQRNEWMADMVLRWRKGSAKTWLLGDCSTASAMAITPEHVFLGALGTLPEHRGKGLARQLLGHIYGEFPGRTLWLSCREELLGFYEDIGFSLTGRMATLQKEGIE